MRLVLSGTSHENDALLLSVAPKNESVFRKDASETAGPLILYFLGNAVLIPEVLQSSSDLELAGNAMYYPDSASVRVRPSGRCIHFPLYLKAKPS